MIIKYKFFTYLLILLIFNVEKLSAQTDNIIDKIAQNLIKRCEMQNAYSKSIQDKIKSSPMSAKSFSQIQSEPEQIKKALEFSETFKNQIYKFNSRLDKSFGSKTFYEEDINFYNLKCAAFGESCDFLKELQTKYKAKTGAEYKTKEPLSSKIQIDCEKYTYTMPSGETYDLKKRIYTNKTQDSKAANKDYIPASPKNEKTNAQVEKANSNESSGYSCEWSNVFPRKILNGPGCSSSGSKICIGYVTCNKYGRKINRLATCSESLCASGTATECAKQLGYGSKSGEGISSSSNSSSDRNSQSNR